MINGQIKIANTTLHKIKHYEKKCTDNKKKKNISSTLKIYKSPKLAKKIWKKGKDIARQWIVSIYGKCGGEEEPNG